MKIVAKWFGITFVILMGGFLANAGYVENDPGAAAFGGIIAFIGVCVGIGTIIDRKEL